MRITVRIDENYEKKIKIIQQRTHLSATDVIKRAIDLLYAESELNSKEKNSRLLTKLTGIDYGSKDGSVNYKHYIAEHILEGE
ncbi:hypothetical protein [Nitrosomonas sp.]|uniref:hypothetical protein n=1 Tax=Nitrosomonas sp. TaxID=42353 RepID=UPI0025D3A13B|nr:hypothetical protein [Nitrosomonas sp.]